MHDAQNHVYECRAKGVFRNQDIKPLVGDNVIFDVLDEENATGNIRSVLPRVSELARPAAANVDQALVLFACRDPRPTWQLLDRYLITLAESGLPSLIGLNKADLAEDTDDLASHEADYRDAGYQVFRICARSGEGISEIREALDGRTTILAGPSGTGKSTLLNYLVPGANMQVGDLSRKVKRGRNTTRHSEIFPVDENTFLMDTPGFSCVFPDDVEADQLKSYFPEFVPYEGQCRFTSCVHMEEPDCAVKKAVQAGELSSRRYESYRAIYTELRQQKKY